MKNDILTEKDNQLLVNSFYDKVNKDDLLGPVFNMKQGLIWITTCLKCVNFGAFSLLAQPIIKGNHFLHT